MNFLGDLDWLEIFFHISYDLFFRLFRLIWSIN